MFRSDAFFAVDDPDVPVRDADEDDFNAEDDETVPPSGPVAAEDRGHGQGEDGHQLDEDVQGRARGILERITDGVADDARLVRVRLLATVNLFVFDVLLGVVPSTASIGHHDGKHETGGNSTSEETTEGLGANEQTDRDRGHDGKDARKQHFVDGSLGAHLDARHVVALDTLLAFEETRNVTELALDFDDDRTGSLTDGKHGEGGEEERQHGTEDDAREDVRVGEEHGISQAAGAARAGTGERNILDVGVHQRKGSQDGGADGETLTGGGGGVTEGIELVGALTDFFRNIRGHFGNTASVVGNRAVGIGGESDAKGGQHTDSGDGDTVQASGASAGNVVAGQDSRDNDDSRREDGDHTNAETLDDDSRGTTSRTGVGDGLGRAVRVGGAEFSGFTDEDTGDETNDDAAKVSVAEVVAVEEDLNARDGQDNHEDGGRVDTTVEGMEKVRLGSIVLGGDGPEADDGGEDTEASDPERQRQFAVVRGKSGARNDGTAEGLEKISTHTGDITNIITNVVRNGGRVAGIIFRNVGFNLTDKIGADVGSLGVDTTGDTREECDGGGTETETREVTDGITHVDDRTREGYRRTIGSIPSLDNAAVLRGGKDVEEDGQTKDTVRDNGEAHDGTTGERDLESLVQARARGFHGLDVGLRRNLHASPAGARGERGADEEAEHGLPATLLGRREDDVAGDGVNRVFRLAFQNTNDERRYSRDERKQVGVLSLEEADGTRRNLFSDEELIARARRGLVHAHHEHENHTERQDTAEERHRGDDKRRDVLMRVEDSHLECSN